MKTLVYGAGVLGSYLAHVLIRGGNEVTILARGSRAEELKRDGLVIRHYFQRKTTTDKVKVISTLLPEEQYDLIFVVMKFNDFPAVLPVLAKNASSNIILVGNNPEAHDTQRNLQELSLHKKNIAFGFQLSGGRREQDRMICVRAGGQMVLGTLDGPVPFHDMLTEVFKHTRYKLSFLTDIDTWLKSHIITILPMNLATFAVGGNVKKLARNKKLLLQIISAMDEGFKVLETLGYTVVPAGQVKAVRSYRKLMYLFLKLYHNLPVARMIDGSVHELAALNGAFDRLKRQSGAAAPDWDDLVAQNSGI
ncbi:2-dehydropantoate 2-reductase N-terminal domain-containing protein [Paenibacillus sp. FSL R7-0345]|uniref:ketopantoate reductase family protein n=1 Tax=Paenibacillus sp. FSL R7-0345 TaxID=2954535 RepID=UPI00315B1C75